MNIYKHIIIHQKLSTSTQEQRMLISYDGQYYEVSQGIIELVEVLQQHETESEAITFYCEKKKGKYTPEQVKGIIDKFVTPLFTPKISKRSFLYEKELFSAQAIDKFSYAFRFLFYHWYMLAVLIIALILDICFFVHTPDLLLFNNKVNIYMIIGLFAFILGSSFFHELGHASACKYFGIQHGGIGFGLYLNFPVLYTDVTEVWKLKRGQRCVVNLAGVYFQSYWLILLLVAFFVTGNDMLRYLILIMNLGFAMTLNPFFKFDGYWIASDLLGVPNLRQRSLELFSYMWNRLKKRPIKQLPYLLQIRRLERYGLLVYSVVVNLFMGYYFLYIIPTFLYRFVQTFPDAVNELILYLSNQMIPPFALLRNIGMQLIFLGLIVYLIYKSIIPLLKRHGRK
ncbi:zinc metalloprotease [Phocaeicola faecicola]|uniref:hypothetical protein n=1 Tax=Phocaeicola faecicola TaxID=2739389 RepID=UPI0015E6AD84|nr:hypothetical protein [Phocaeicola faecicola]MDD6909136.1 hypothetical protein [Bacteroidaceae bacterium]